MPAFLVAISMLGARKAPAGQRQGRNAFSNSTIILALHLTITDEVA